MEFREWDTARRVLLNLGTWIAMRENGMITLMLRSELSTMCDDGYFGICIVNLGDVWVVSCSAAANWDVECGCGSK